MKSLVTTYDDAEIYVDDGGWFWAEKDGQEFKARSLPMLKKKLAAVQNPIDVIELSSCWGVLGEVHRQEIVKDSRRGRFRSAKTGSLCGQYDRFYHYDPGLVLELVEIQQQFIALKERYDNIMRKARAVRWSEIKK